jgi:hypothetical protein
MKIEVKSSSRAYKVPVEVIEHDCYETDDYTIEAYTYYQPTPQQIDQGTDHDETGYIAVCNVCGEDMPDIDLFGYPWEADDDQC